MFVSLVLERERQITAWGLVYLVSSRAMRNPASDNKVGGAWETIPESDL